MVDCYTFEKGIYFSPDNSVCPYPYCYLLPSALSTCKDLYTITCLGIRETQKIAHQNSTWVRNLLAPTLVAPLVAPGGARFTSLPGPLADHLRLGSESAMLLQRCPDAAPSKLITPGGATIAGLSKFRLQTQKLDLENFCFKFCSRKFLSATNWE